MRTRLISALSLVLLTVFVFNVCIFGVMLSAQLALHQQEQQEKIRNKKHKEIIELRIHRDVVESHTGEFQWMKDWEFRWLGEMYDIEESVLDGDVWVFHVKHDTKEDMLRKKMERHAQDENKKRESQAKKNLKCGSEFFDRSTFAFVSEEKNILLPVQAPPSLPVVFFLVSNPPPELS